MVQNNTGLPDNLKTGMESLSGMSLDHVKVHYNSSKPAQVQAHAYTQGTDIHLAPSVSNPYDQSSAKVLCHELWHVVQQKQGRVKSALDGGLIVDEAADVEADAKAQEVVSAL